MKRKGFAIIEMVVTMAVMMVLLFLMVKPTRALFVDMNHMQKDFNANSTVYDMLTKLEKDIERADSLRQDPVDPNALLLEGNGRTVRYKFAEGYIKKYVIGNSQQTLNGKESLWTAPHAIIKHKLWEQEGVCYAVEITKGIERKVLGRWEKKLANSYVFFVGATSGKANNGRMQ